MQTPTVSPKEQIYISRLSQAEVILELANYDWGILTSWDGVGTCLAAVQAIFTNAMDEGSAVCAQAQNWVGEQKDNPLLRAVVLQYASYSSESRSLALVKIVDPCGLMFSPKEQQTWSQLRAGVRPTWQELPTVCQLGHWEAMPPANQPELTDACRRLMRSDEKYFPNMARDFIADPEIQGMPALCQRIVTMALESGDDSIFGEIRQHFPCFAEGIVAVLTEEPTTVYSSNVNAEDCRYAERLFDLAQLFAFGASQLPEAEQRSLTDQLLEVQDHPWVWSIAPELVPWAASIEKLGQFIYWWLNDGKRDHTIWKCQESEASTLRGLTYRAHDRLSEVVAQLSPAAFSTLVESLAEEGYNGSRIIDHYLKADYQRLLEEGNPEFLPLAAAVVRSGVASSDFVQSYLDKVGFEAGKTDFLSWMEKFRGGFASAITEPLLRDYFIPNGLSVCRFIISSDVKMLLEAGYQLSSQDVDSEEQVGKILSTHGHDKPEATVVWENDQWRATILLSGQVPKLIVESLLASANANHGHKAAEWLLENFVPLANRPEIRVAFCRAAWYSNGNDLAQLVLVRGGLIENWMSDGDRQRMTEYIKQYWSPFLRDHQVVADAILSLDRQRDLFFESALKSSGNLDTISLWPGPVGWERLFADEPSRARMKSWLLAHRETIRDNDWLDWVCHFDFVSDPAVLKRIRRLLDSRHEEVVKTVIVLLCSMEGK